MLTRNTIGPAKTLIRLITRDQTLFGDIMKINVLSADIALRKSYVQQPDGTLKKESYPNAYEFTSEELTCNTTKDLYNVVNHAANKGACLLKGHLKRPLAAESRAGSTDATDPTEWICFDLDGIKGVSTPDKFLERINVRDVSYVVQYSSSMGVEPAKGLACHIFIRLNKPVAPGLLKIWIQDLNHKHFADELSLTRSGMALSWPLDVTTNQNDKLLYVAPPECTPPSLDQFQGPRISYVQGKKDAFDFESSVTVPAAEVVKQQTDALINNLRKTAKLPERKRNTYKTDHGIEYLSKPDQSTVTSVKQERGFVYLNLNGGDSWAYWHPENNFEFIYNFKGEPTYKTKEIAPDYYQALKRRSTQQAVPGQKQDDKQYFVGRHFRTAEYFNCIYNVYTFELEFAIAKNVAQLHDFLAQYNQPIPEIIQDWSIKYDPLLELNKTVDPVTRTINTFKATKYMQPTDRKVEQIPPVISKIVSHVLNGETELIDRFHNTVAHVLRNRTAATSAWVFLGIEGTGKGLIVNRILTPLLGKENVEYKRLEELEDKFNQYLENKLLCFVDESEMAASTQSRKIMANLKNQITEPVISVRGMREMPRLITNHVTWIFASNKTDPLTVSETDRRFNVGGFVNTRLHITDAEVDSLELELNDYAAYLHQLKINTDWLRNPLLNQAKQELIETSRTGIETVAKALRDGNLQLLHDSITTNSDPETILVSQAYKGLINGLILDPRDVLTREEVALIFRHTTGNVPISPIKFTQFLKHYSLYITVHRSGNKTTRGLKVNWYCDADWLSARRAELLNLANVTIINAKKDIPNALVHK